MAITLAEVEAVLNQFPGMDAQRFGNMMTALVLRDELLKAQARAANAKAEANAANAAAQAEIAAANDAANIAQQQLDAFYASIEGEG